MSQRRGKPDELPQPEIKRLGKWPSVIDSIRQLARDHGIPADEIEPFVQAILEAKSEGSPQKEWPYLAEVEIAYVETVLRRTEGNKQAAARLLNIDRKTLDRIIKRKK
jgi:DNA-binding NtrC family response regulator